MGDLRGKTSLLTSSSFGSDVKLGGPMPGCGMHCGPELAFSS